MASSFTFRASNGLGFLGPSKVRLNSVQISIGMRSGAEYMAPKCAVSSSRPVPQPRFVQHKETSGSTGSFPSCMTMSSTRDMRDDALESAELCQHGLKAVDVGGFTTLSIVKRVDSQNITLLDQSPSPHQLEKARKEALKGVTIIEGDAEDLPFPTDTFDRYVSAGR